MDLILLILSASKEPMLASEIGPLLAKHPNAVRVALANLLSQGLVQKTQVGNKGPVGTWKWKTTESGDAAVSEVLEWIRKP
jgi:predicted ArsR family transcriptional regulator